MDADPKKRKESEQYSPGYGHKGKESSERVEQRPRAGSTIPVTDRNPDGMSDAEDRTDDTTESSSHDRVDSAGS